MYPATNDYFKGKLRLVYECNPFSFIMEMAGGKATDGKRNILDLEPGSLHERTPFFAGSSVMMNSFSRG